MTIEMLGNVGALAFLGRLQITDADGAPCPGAQLHISGKVEGGRGDAHEPMALYADAARTMRLPNPVVADAAGMLPLIYLDSSPFDCMASTANRILWSYFGCKGFAYAGGNDAGRATSRFYVFSPDRCTAATTSNWRPQLRPIGWVSMPA
jgi:hypothetical protein